MSVMPLTLAVMATLEERGTDVAGATPAPSEADGAGVLRRPYRALSIGIVSVVLLIAFEATAVGTAMPVAAWEPDGVSVYAFAFSGYFTTSLFGMVLAGQWSDRRGPLGSLTSGMVAFAAGLLSAIPAVAGAALLVPAVLGLLPRGTYRAARGLPLVVLLCGVAAGSFIAAESFVPLMLVTQRELSPTLAGFSLAAGGVTWALGSWVQSRPRLEPYRERLMTAGMVLVAAAIATVPSVLIEAAPVWSMAVAWAFGCFGMGLVISSTSVLLLHLSAPEEAGANSASLQISDGLSNVILLAAGGAAFAALGGGTVTHATTESTASHPAASVVVFLSMAGMAGMAGMALAGAWVTTRLRER